MWEQIKDWITSEYEIYLAPGDTTPPPGKHRDIWDYRGCAKESALRSLAGANGVPLARYRFPRKRLIAGVYGADLFLPISQLFTGTCVVGPAGSGKTENIIIPWSLKILASGGSVVIPDAKGDLADVLGERAAEVGARVWLWDPSRGDTMQWNWFDNISDQRSIEAAVLSILGPKSEHADPYWYDRDVLWLRALIKIVKTAYPADAQPYYLARLLADQESLREFFRKNDSNPEVTRLAGSISALFRFTSEEYAKAVTSLRIKIDLFEIEYIYASCRSSSFDINELCDEPTLLIIGASLADGNLGVMLSSLMLTQIMQFIYSRFRMTSEAPRNPLFLLIDEAGRFKDRIKYEEFFSVARSARGGALLALQDISQLGEEREQVSVLSNCDTFISLYGASQETAHYLSKRLGERDERIVIGEQIQRKLVPVLAEREIMYPIQRFVAVAHVRNVVPKPFLIDFTREVAPPVSVPIMPPIEMTPDLVPWELPRPPRAPRPRRIPEPEPEPPRLLPPPSEAPRFLLTSSGLEVALQDFWDYLQKQESSFSPPEGSEEVRRLQLTVAVDGKHVLLTDLGDSPGIRVNGSLLSCYMPHTLKSGDLVVDIGQFRTVTLNGEALEEYTSVALINNACLKLDEMEWTFHNA